MSRTNETATCAMTKAPRRRWRERLEVMRPPACLKASLTHWPVEAAGASPNNTPVASETRTREEQNRQIDVHLGRASGETSGEFHQYGKCGRRQQQPERTAGQRKHHAFGEQLADQAAATGAQRGAHGEFAFEFQHARQQQVGHIRAGDQQHETGAGQKHEEGGAAALRQFGLQRGGLHGVAVLGGIIVRVCAFHLACGHRKIRLGFFERHTGLEAAKNGHHACAAVADKLRTAACGALRGGHVNIGFSGILRDRRQHAQNGVRAVVHLEYSAHDVRVAALVALPVFVAQDQDGGRVFAVVGGHEGAAQQRLDAQDIEEIGRYYGGFHALGGVRADEQEVHHVMFHDAAQRVIAVAVIVELLHGEGHVVDMSLAELLMQHHQLAAIAIRQRAKEHAVHNAENRRVGADAKGQSDDCGGRKSGVLEQHAGAIADVLQERLHGPPGAGIAAILL